MVTVKGGVWTNIEDEVLKAAISKYGLNQWARVSSLLARKTPKQCKARWTEYLDPSIRKIEWSKDEDEKLLHLAKLMPTQWRTIAPIVGRTANQCLERYQRLLDEAERAEGGAPSGLGLGGVDDAAPTADAVRKLRPGEVDPDPESKPARPDTIDLDEDEKEMLSEARARLANTQGKKAKRKAREREQEESRRLALLQKRRELKTAGINVKVVTRKPGQMDYNADIPFEKKPAAGFYDTTAELADNERARTTYDPRLAGASNKRKGQGDDHAKTKKPKNDKNGTLSEAAAKAGQMQRVREAEQSSKRRALVLPAPQVSEAELEDIVKMGAAGQRAAALAQAGDSTATRGLVQDYTAPMHTPAQPLRTPRAAPGEDRVANEIRTIRAQTQTQSSLLGGENTPLREGAASTGFASAMPAKQDLATPNPLATPRSTTVHGARGVLATPRDSLALNRHADAAHERLRQGLAALPAPKDVSWDMELPDEPRSEVEAAEMTTELLPEDAADRDRREQMQREALEALERKRRTQAVQRGLPRPATVDLAALLARAATVADPAASLVAHEAALLVAHDAHAFPLGPAGRAGPGAGPARQTRPPVVVEAMGDDALAEARLQVLLEAKRASKDDAAAWTGLAKNDSAVLLGLGCYDDDDDDLQDSLQDELQEARAAAFASAKKGAKLEKKLALTLGGYRQRSELLKKKTADAHSALGTARGALHGFETLARSETAALARRLAALRDEVAYVSRREREAQELFRANREELLALGGQPVL